MKALLLSLALLAPAVAHANADIRRADRRAVVECQTLTAGAAAATKFFDINASTYAYNDRKFVLISMALASATDYVRISTFSANVSGQPWYAHSNQPLYIGPAIPLWLALPAGMNKSVCAYQAE